MKEPIFPCSAFCKDQMVSADVWCLCTHKYMYRARLSTEQVESQRKKKSLILSKNWNFPAIGCWF